MLGTDEQENESLPPCSFEEVKECDSVVIMQKVNRKNKVFWTTGGCSVEGVEFHHQKGSHS